MIEQDLFVGLVAICLGFFVVGSAILNTAGFSRFWICRRLENSFGPGVARLVGCLIGFAVGILGILLMLGWLPAKKPRAGHFLPPQRVSSGHDPVWPVTPVI